MNRHRWRRGRAAGTRRRGMASIVAVGTIPLVAVALAAMLSLFAAEIRRTRDAAAGAQLRQLLVAGEWAARDRVGKNAGPVTEPADVPVMLPAELGGGEGEGADVGAALRLRIEPGEGPERVNVRVAATVGRAGAAQALVFERKGAGWELVRAELVRPDGRE